MATTLYVLGLITLVVLFWESAAAAVRTWYVSDTYNHCFLIIPISAWLVWRRRAPLMEISPRPSLPGIAILVLAALIWRIGELSGTLVVQQFALIGMAQALFLAIMGGQSTRALAFPLLYTYFAVPFGSALTVPLQGITADGVLRLLHLSGIPAHLDGFLIEIPGSRFHIAEACAGVRFLVASLAIGVLAAHLFFRRWTRRLAFIVLAMLVPILANGLRAYGIVSIAHLDSLVFARQVDHLTFGLVFLSLVLAFLLGLGFAMRDKVIAGEAPAVPSSARPGHRAMASSTRFLAVSAIALAVIIGVRAAEWNPSSDRASRVMDLPIPEVRPPWSPQLGSDRSWSPRAVRADARILQRYTNEVRVVDFFAAYFTHQRQGAEVVNQQNDLAGGARWSSVPGASIEVRQGAANVRLGSARLVSDTGNRLLWYCYWVDGTCSSDPISAKIRQVKAALLGGTSAAAIIAVATPVTGTDTEAALVLREFLRHLESFERWSDRLEASSGAGSPDASAGPSED